MKRNWLFTLFIALSFCAIGFTGCGDDDDDGTGDGGDTGNSLVAGDFVVTTDGAEWKATNIQASKANGVFTFSATKGTETITLRINDVVTGTYPLVLANANEPGFNGYAIYSPESGSQNLCNVDNGQVIISEIDATAKTVSGTFNFNCTYQQNMSESESLTDGEFYKITYNE